MEIFFDLEFTGLHQHTTPISLGLVAKNGRTFYAEFTDYDRSQVNEWIEQNVIANLVHTNSPVSPEGYVMKGANTVVVGERWTVADRLREWLESFEEPTEMWGDVLTYDWMLFVQLFGHGLSLPNCVYYIPFDISTLLKARGIDPDINREQFSGRAVLMGPKDKHNALWDARITKACWQILTGEKGDKAPDPDEYQDQIGRLADKADNYLAATNLAMPAEFHLKQLKAGLKEISDSLKAIYEGLTGSRPWGEQKEE